MSRPLLMAAVVAAASVGAALTAQQSQQPSFTTATRTVAVYATVTNAQ